MDLLYLKIQINNFHLIFSVNYVKKLVMKHVIVNAISLLAMNAKKFYAIIEHANVIAMILIYIIQIKFLIMIIFLIIMNR